MQAIVRKWKNKNILIWLLLLISNVLYSNGSDSLLVVSALDKSIEIDNFSVFPDTLGSYTFEEICDTNFAHRFSHHYKTLSENVEYYWIKLSIINKTGYDLPVVLSIFPGEEIDFYPISPDGYYKKRHGGYYVTSDSLDFPYFSDCFSYLLLRDCIQNVYFRVKRNKIKQKSVKSLYISDYSKKSITIVISKDETIDEIINDRNILNAISVAIFVIMLAYNFIIFLFIGDKSFLHYTLGFLGTALYYLSHDSIIMSFVSISGFANLYVFLIADLVLIISFANFIRFTLEAPSRFKKWNKAFLFYIYINIPIFIGVLFCLDQQGSFIYNILKLSINLLSICLTVLMLIFSIAVIKRKYAPANYFLISNLLLAVLIIIYVLGMYNVLPQNYFIKNSMRFGVIIQSLLFSIALAARYRIILKENEEAERKKIIEINRIIEAKNKELEVTVTERTADVVQQNEEIQTQSEMLLETNSRLVELDKFKEGVTAMIAHDLKNPLNSIIGLTENSIVRKSGMQMLNMVMNMLDVYKYEHAEIKLDRNVCLISKISDSALLQVNILFEEKGIEIQNSIPPNCFVDIDKEIIERVFVNILTNAIKYTPNNGKIILNSDFSGQSSVGNIKIEITDNGLGIPKNKLNTIFNRFEQVKDKKSGKTRSTGIGLTYCKLAVEAHSGEISVHSDAGEGATFWFTLPIADTPASVIQSIHDESQTVEASIEENDGLFALAETDKQLLNPFLSQLQKLEVYESTKIEKLLDHIDTRNSIKLQQWKAEMENAAYVVNDLKFIDLIEMLK